MRYLQHYPGGGDGVAGAKGVTGRSGALVGFGGVILGVTALVPEGGADRGATSPGGAVNGGVETAASVEPGSVGGAGGLGGAGGVGGVMLGKVVPRGGGGLRKMGGVMS